MNSFIHTFAKTLSIAFILLFITLSIVSGQTDTTIRFAPPVSIEKPPVPPYSSTSPSVTQTHTLLSGDFTPEWMLIKELNAPLNKATLHEKTLKIVNGGEELLIKKVGKTHFEAYFRLYKDRILSLDKKIKKQGYFGRESRIIYYYEIVYDNHLIGTEMIMMDTTGNPLPEFYNKPNLSAYKALFDGEVTVSCDEALKIVLGENLSGIHYNLSLKKDYHPLSKWPENQKSPQIWWEIWENGCTICKEGKVDAKNAQNYKTQTINRNEETNPSPQD